MGIYVLLTLFLRIASLNAFTPVNDPLSPEMVIFNAAIELPAAERLTYLSQACSGDTELLHRLQLLLKAHEASGKFLLEGVAGTSSLSAKRPGSRFRQARREAARTGSEPNRRGACVGLAERSERSHPHARASAA